MLQQQDVWCQLLAAMRHTFMRCPKNVMVHTQMLLVDTARGSVVVRELQNRDIAASLSAACSTRREAAQVAAAAAVPACLRIIAPCPIFS
jgi:cysteine sulfinate desulfinase/cysteine desulfurase-like protein